MKKTVRHLWIRLLGREWICGILSLQLMFGYAQSAAADAVWTQPVLRQYVVSRALDELMPKLLAASSTLEIEKLIPLNLSPRDRTYLHNGLSKNRRVLKFVRLNRGISITTREKKNFTVVLEDVMTMRMRVDEKVDFSIRRDVPLERQIELLRKALLPATAAGPMNLLVPQANALMGWDDFLVLALVGILFTGVANKVLNDVFGDGLWEYAKDWWCQGKTEATGPATAKFCASIFKWQAEHVKDKEVPHAKDPVAIVPKPVEKSVTESCKQKGSSEMVRETVNTETKQRVRTTIKFDKDNKPNQVVFVISSEDNSTGEVLSQQITLDLSETGAIKEARDSKGAVIATGDKTATGTMTPTQLSENAKKLDQVNKLLEPAIEIVKACNSAAEESIVKASGAPATALADEVAAIKSPSAPRTPTAPIK